MSGEFPFGGRTEFMPEQYGTLGADAPSQSILDEIHTVRSEMDALMQRLAAQMDLIQNVENTLLGVSTDDIEIETDPVTGKSYWHIPKLDELESAVGSLASSATFPAQITEWNAGTTNYSWGEVHRNSADTSWKTFSGNRNSADFNNARHFELWQNLPCTAGKPILVMMQITTDADGDLQPFFSVPIQRDAAFTHRTDLTGTGFNAGNRLDLTLTEAELETEDVNAGLDWDLETQTSGVHGYVKTEPSRDTIYIAGGDEVVYGYVQDVEYDVMGRPVSRSEEFRHSINTPKVC